MCYKQKVIINNGNRPQRTSNKPIRSDRNISRRKNANIILRKELINHKPIKNDPPSPKIPPESPKPLIKMNFMEKNEYRNSNKWSENSDDESLPEIPKEWNIYRY